MIKNLFVLCCFFITCYGDSVKRPRGVPLSMLSMYPVGSTFTCFDGSSTIPFERINDDYCDCIDGSDEPGTAACPNGSFYCSNKGYKPFFIPTSRVNDGVCDCCDGSDEYASASTCANDCYELGQAAREEEARKLAVFKEGNKVRLELSLKGKQIKREKQLRLLELTKEITEAELLKSEKETIKNTIEEQEKVVLDAHRQLEEEKRKEIEEAERVRNEEEALMKFKELDKNDDGLIQKDEIVDLQVLDQDKDGVVSDDEIKMFMSEDEAVSFEAFLVSGWQYLKQIFALQKVKQSTNYEGQTEEHSVSDEREESDKTDREQHYDDGEDEDDREEVESLDEVETSSESDIRTDDVKIEYNEEVQKIIDEANNARSEYDNADRNVRDIQREIKQIEETLNKDYGQEDEFAYLVGECFEYTDREYTYKLCPFDQVTQRPKDGGSETSLGVWGNWIDDRYDYMHYTRGQSCWNGPQRHTKVKLVCDVKTEVIAASEPNRCEYLLEFNTPAMCILKETQERTDDYHDEL